MLLVGLTGGIASGKTTVARMLSDRGAVVIDTDEIAREVVEPGTQAWSKIIEHFGAGVLLPDKRINRELLGSIVFAEPAKRALLNEITHPEVMRVMAARLETLAPTDGIVVCVIPLLAETGSSSMFNVVVVVNASEQTQVSRLRTTRGMSDADARARIAAQASPSDRLAIADVVIDNDGEEADLAPQIDALWQRFLAPRGP